MPLKVINSKVLIEFIDHHIITMFGLPSILTFDDATYFFGNLITKFVLKIGFKIKYYANYYPQWNEVAKSKNKNILIIIKRTIDENKKNWHKSLVFSIWEDIITYKASLGTSPYYLVYGREAILPPDIAFPSLYLVQSIEEKLVSSLQLRLSQLFKLEEGRNKEKQIYAKHKNTIKSCFDSNSTRNKVFEVCDLVLKWDKAHEEKAKHTNF